MVATVIQAPVNNANPFPVSITSLVPNDEGPRSIALMADFSAGGDLLYNFDLALVQRQGKFSRVQSIFVDNSQNAASATIIVTDTQERIVVNPNGQGVWPIICNNARLTIECVGGTGVCAFQLLNVLLPYQTWGSASGSSVPFQFDGAGDLLVDDPTVRTNTTTIASIVSGGRALVTPNIPHGSPTSRSTVTVATTSTVLMALNANRQYLLIQAPATADLWLNLLGGTASVAGADCFFLPAGSKYESGNYCITAAITYFCATGSLELAALEG